MKEIKIFNTSLPFGGSSKNFYDRSEKYLNYNGYNDYRGYNMENTTIAVRKDVKEKLTEFATKKETYSEVIERLLESAEKRMLNDFLFNEEGFVPIEDAMAEAKKRWPKSK